MIARHALRLIGIIGLMFVTEGCYPYVADYEYLPHPAIVVMGSNTTQPAIPVKQPLIVYATIIGVRRTDAEHHLPLSVEARLRFDGAGPQNVEFDPRSFGLITGELLRFAPPIVQPPQKVSIGSGQSVVLLVYFPFPSGTSYEQIQMGSLLLHWQVRIDGQIVPQSARFHRISSDYIYDPRRDWGYPVNLGYPFVGGTAEVQRPE